MSRIAHNGEWTDNLCIGRGFTGAVGEKLPVLRTMLWGYGHFWRDTGLVLMPHDEFVSVVAEVNRVAEDGLSQKVLQERIKKHNENNQRTKTISLELGTITVKPFVLGGRKLESIGADIVAAHTHRGSEVHDLVEEQQGLYELIYGWAGLRPPSEMPQIELRFGVAEPFNSSSPITSEAVHQRLIELGIGHNVLLRQADILSLKPRKEQ